MPIVAYRKATVAEWQQKTTKQTMQDDNYTYGLDGRQYIIREAIEEQRQIFGAENPQKQWILSDWDTWERNPFYTGPDQGHPED